MMWIVLHVLLGYGVGESREGVAGEAHDAPLG